MRSLRIPYWARSKRRNPYRILQQVRLSIDNEKSDAFHDLLQVNESASNSNKPILSFSGDAEDEDAAVDLFSKAIEADDDEGGQEEGEEEDGEPEDDFNAAWEVLDLARAIYDKQVTEEDGDEVKLKLADTYITLGDVSLETGNAAFSLHMTKKKNLFIYYFWYRKVRPSHFGLRSRPQT